MLKTLLLIFLSTNFGSTYSIGDTVSVEDQNLPFEVHYGDYPSDTLRLSDHQGKIIIFGLSASWWPTVCTTSLEALLNNYSHDPRIFIFENLDDPGQPYTYEQWGDMAQEGIPIIVDDIGASIGSYTLYDWFSINNYYMEMVVLDHNMIFRRLTTSTYVVGTEIEEIFRCFEDFIPTSIWIICIATKMLKIRETWICKLNRTIKSHHPYSLERFTTYNLNLSEKA